MTISSTSLREYANGNGVTTVFTFPNRFLANSDLVVYVDSVLQTITTHYTVTGADDPAGGEVTFLTAPPVGTGNVVIINDPAATQGLDLVENDDFPEEEVETALDRAILLIQRLKDLQGRAITLSDSDADAALSIPVLDDRISKLLGFDSSGDLIAVLSATDIETLNDNVDSILAMFSDMSSLDFNSVNFDVTPTDTNAVGRLVWNDTDGTLNLGLKGGVSVLQLGQEVLIRAVNKTGSAISNGQAVRITGSHGNRVTIVKAQADSAANSSKTIGLATEDIANNAEGFVTMLGLVRDVDTSGFSEGDEVWLSSSTAGGLVNTEPTISVHVGWVSRSHATLGSILVHVTIEPEAANTQIQPISASVAANALTISASALTLDFRSTTLGSGTVTTVSSTPSNLVVPSSATLGTANATQSRLIVIALNNAGTIELAVVNISGGTNLDETTLLTTTAISASSTSASTVYSTSARTSVAFRVIGYIESTQTTAGTWATAPSTIQGYGGQALAVMSSIGYSQTWQDVTASRAAGTTYTNTTGRPITAIITVNNNASFQTD